ncbi:MAG TPA: glycerol-3-phosphate acyltransferase, partial [Bacteroidota bacterium]|nr:glycerol-3-phosphate acyltransferase [Bacteroidota bacterium]
GIDVRQTGSGSTGARNVSRLLGAYGFLITSFLDGLKGVAAALIGGAVPGSEWLVPAVIVAVVCGHIWPIQLGFRGGKGIAPAIGALVVYDPLVLLFSATVSLLVLAALRNVTVAGLAMVTMIPVVALCLGRPLESQVLTSLIVVLILISHRKNIREEIARFQKSHKERKS